MKACMWESRDRERDREREVDIGGKKTEESKFGPRAPVYVTSDLRHFLEPTPSPV